MPRQELILLKVVTILLTSAWNPMQYEPNTAISKMEEQHPSSIRRAVYQMTPA